MSWKERLETELKPKISTIYVDQVPAMEACKRLVDRWWPLAHPALVDFIETVVIPQELAEFEKAVKLETKPDAEGWCECCGLCTSTAECRCEWFQNVIEERLKDYKASKGIKELETNE